MRWWVKGILIAFALVVVAVVSAYYYLFQLHGFERIISEKLTSLVSKQLPLTIELGQVRGDLLNGLILEDVRVTVRDSIGSYPIFRAGRVTATYSLSNLWHENYRLSFLGLDSVSILLFQDSSGAIRLPQPGTARSDSVETEFPALHVDLFLLEHSSVTLVKGRDTLLVSDINLSSALHSEDGALSANLKQGSFQSNRTGLALSTMSGRLAYTNGQLLVQNMLVSKQGTQVRLNGFACIDQPSFQMQFDADNIDVGELGEAIGVRLDGAIDANGNVSYANASFTGTAMLGGRFLFAGLQNLFVGFRFTDRRLALDTLYGIVFDQCAIDGKGEIDFSPPRERYQLQAKIRNFNLKSVAKSSFISNLNGDIDLRGRSFRHDDLRLDVGVNLYESSFGGYPIQSAEGALAITMDSLLFEDGFAVTYFENDFRVSGKVEYSRDIDLEILANLQNLDRYKGKLFINRPGGRGYGEARLTGLTSDPDLTGTFVSDSLWLYDMSADSAWAVYHIDRFLSRQQGEVSLRLMNGTLWNRPYDTAYATMALDSGVATLDTIFLNGSRGAVASRGEMVYNSNPMRLELDTLHLVTLGKLITNDKRQSALLDSNGVEITRLYLVGSAAKLIGSGRINYDESMDLRLFFDNVPVKEWGRLVREDIPFDGIARFGADLTGTFDSPRFSVRGGIDSLVYKSLNVGDLKVGASYDARKVTIDSLTISSGPGQYRVSGHFGVDLSFRSLSAGKLLDDSIDVSFAATDRRFDLVSILLPTVEQLDGDFVADVRLFGTPSSPHLEGQGYLKNGRLKYLDLVDSLYTDSAGVTMNDNQIVIDNVVTYVKNKRRPDGRSYANIDGTITVKALDTLVYDLDVSIPREFPFRYELDDIQGIIEGDMRIEGSSPPLVTGDLTVISARYRAKFASENEGSPLMVIFSGENTWDVNLNVDILSNYWIKNEDIDAEFSGSLNVIRERGEYRFIGEMEMLRGKGFLFDKTFRIEPGSRVIFDNTTRLNPTLDITAFTRIPGVSRPNDESREPIDLGLHITGTLETPDLNLTSDSLFRREDILPLLVANYATSDTASTPKFSRVEERLTGLVSSQVSQIGTKELSRLGVETFEIDPNYERGQLDPLRSRVTLGFYTAPNLYIYGRSALSGSSGQELGFEYRLNKSMRVEGGRDDQALYQLNLKLHVEF